jgi:periplasmic protein TonB
MSAVNEGALQQRGLGSGHRSKGPVAVPNPVTLRKQGVFATAIIEEDARARGKRAVQTGFAFALQLAVVGTLLLVPLFFTEGIDLYKVNSAMLIAPPPPAAPPPPMVHAEAVAPKPSFIKAQLTAPTVIPKKIVQTADASSMAPTVAGMTGGVPGGMGDVLGGVAAGLPPPPPPAAEKSKGPIRITSGMKEPQLLYEPPIVYSPVARLAHVEGTVIVEAIIDEQGNVTQVHLISGPPLLVPGAMKAVAARRYAPTTLDGQPVAVRLTVKVDYKLS